ncbi:MAG TPA: trehalose-6-phosphate synthase [Anaerolineales bacterium]
MATDSNSNRKQDCEVLQSEYLANRKLILVSNRGPVKFLYDENGERTYTRGGGGLVTALLGLAQHVDATWVAAADTDADKEFKAGNVELDNRSRLKVRFIEPSAEAYAGYYNVISNPLLWFLQHNMWDGIRTPNITRETWDAWNEGYVKVNEQFADAVAEEVKNSDKPCLVMMQDYHLYLAPQFLRRKLKKHKNTKLMHFIHIPWPGPEDWGMLPSDMRGAILDGLCSVDLLGFQTRDDALNFIRTCETHMARVSVNYKRGRVWVHNHSTHVRDFPISIDVKALRALAESENVSQYKDDMQRLVRERKLILRIERTEPSKNIVRGFEAYDEMLELHPEHRGNVKFLALFVPSRLGVDEYQNYLDEIMASAGRVNAKYGNSDWEPIRILVGEDYPRAVAALQKYDVLLVNAIADGMNLVAKEGPIVNQRDGVVVLSERTGARQQLQPGAIVISPYDIYTTAEALHNALTMPAEERAERATRLRWIIEREDIAEWLCLQLEALQELRI